MQIGDLSVLETESGISVVDLRSEISIAVKVLDEFVEVQLSDHRKEEEVVLGRVVTPELINVGKMQSRLKMIANCPSVRASIPDDGTTVELVEVRSDRIAVVSVDGKAQGKWLAVRSTADDAKSWCERRGLTIR